MRHARADYDRIQDPAGLIPADEPVFIIRAQDRVSGDAVRAWATLAEAAGAKADIVEAARRHASAMDAWGTKQVPDMPTEPATTQPLRLFMFEGEGREDGGWAKALIAASSKEAARAILADEEDDFIEVEDDSEVCLPTKPGLVWSSLDGL